MPPPARNSGASISAAAIGGGVITYTADGAQKVAVAAGFTLAAWPTKIVTAKVVVLGLDGAATASEARDRRDEDAAIADELEASMELDPVILSRIQFAFVISFHIIFPAFTIGLAAWLATIEGMRLFTGNPLYRRVFDFWLKVFAVSFGMGVVTGIVMAFQFGTNWGVLAERTGSIQGPLLGYEAFTAFMLEATLLRRHAARPRPGVAAASTSSPAAWCRSERCSPRSGSSPTTAGCRCRSATRSSTARSFPADWREIVLGPVMMVRWPHMLLAAFLTTAMCVAATGAWYVLRGVHRPEARVMLHWGLGLAAVLIPVQLFFGHLTGLYVLKHQPAKFAAIEARWQTPATGLGGADRLARRGEPAQPASRSRSPGSAASSPRATGPPARSGWTPSRVEDRPPVLIPFFGFRIMVGMGLIMLGVSWFGNFLRWRGRLETTRWFLWGTFLSFPTGFVAVLSGWYTAEVGRQPWVVYGLLRTRDAVTPSLTTGDVLVSLTVYVLVYAVFVGFGTFYIYKLLREGPAGAAEAIPNATASRPLAFADTAATRHRQPDGRPE